MLYPHKKFLICGDYNVADAVWINDTLGVDVSNSNNPKASQLANTFGYLHMYQCNFIMNSRNRLLDLVFSNIPKLSVSKAEDTLFRSSIHHEPIVIGCSGQMENSLSYSEYYYDFKNADYLAINNLFADFNWNQLKMLDVNEANNIFYCVIYEAMNSFVPLKLFKKSHFPIWFSPELKHLVREKTELHRKFKQSGNYDDYRVFSGVRHNVNNSAMLVTNIT
ncbi:hypothetical protein JTB14_018284 [Gonioctena quinquepunctata]|nr:hypothetical protein JTB14_018284 [Gonioctena quinquepunctata]